jgi:hypothetical protein
LWVGLWGGGAVHRYLGGQLSEVVEVPTRYVTCPIFVAPTRDQLVRSSSPTDRAPLRVCEVTGGRAAFVAASSAPPTATISMDTECYVLLATGRRTIDDVDQRVSVSGDDELAALLLAGLNVLF